MISQPIVLVVGAGASAEFGLPVGSSLIERISRVLDFSFDPAKAGQIIGDPDLLEMLVGSSSPNPSAYRDAAAELSKRVRGFYSIDEALHWYSARPEIVEIGKAAIVHQILRAERESSLFHSANPSMIRPATAYTGTWLFPFLSMVMAGIRKEETPAAFRNVTIINFNYDRTIEHFLVNQLQMGFGVSREAAIESLSNLFMIRPYGSVGPLPFQGSADTVSFGATIGRDRQKLLSLATNISTYTEQNVAAGSRQAMTVTIDRCKMIVYLGFGFHDQNLSLLQGSARAHGRRILATVKGIDAENHRALSTRLLTLAMSDNIIHVQLLDRTAYGLLETMRPTFMATL